MEITWFAHSCFRLKAGNVTVLTDPYPKTIGGRLDAIKPTLVTISNQHPNHSHLNGLATGYNLIDGPGEYSVSGVYVKGIMTQPSDPESSGERNTAYFMEMDGLRLCHLGDLSSSISKLDIDELTPLDVLFVPVGGNCTIDVAHISEIAQRLSARIIIPMHYKVPGVPVDLGGLDPFLREMGVKEDESQPRITVTTSNLPLETRIVLLKPIGIRQPGGS